MSNRTIQVTPELHQYILDTTVREPEILRRLREETAPLAGAGMQISPEQGQFMRLLIKMIGAKRTIEVGTFTGYSALSVALVLPDDGLITACDVSEEWTNIGRRFWQAAGVDHKIDLTIAPAVETLQGLVDDESQHETYDFAFVDADKNNYETYYEQCFKLLRRGGIMAIDNVLWGGSVINDQKQDDDTIAIRRVNALSGQDDRFDVSLVPIGDGLTLLRKR